MREPVGADIEPEALAVLEDERRRDPTAALHKALDELWRLRGVMEDHDLTSDDVVAAMDTYSSRKLPACWAEKLQGDLPSYIDLLEELLASARSATSGRLRLVP